MKRYLNKPPRLSIDPKKPWAEDAFSRKAHGVTLTRLIESLQQSFVVSINGEWGSGKSVFLEQLSAHLEIQRIPVIKIDAWKSDYRDDPLLAFVAATADRVEKHGTSSPEDLGVDVIKALATHSGKLVLPTIDLLAALFSPGTLAITGKAIESIGKLGTEALALERAKVSAEEGFRNQMIKARDLLTNRRKGERIGRVVVIVDELDRCRPDYAVKLLERIKHFFDVDGIIFLIATDGSNIPIAIKTVYGQSVDGEKYLRKFFDFEYHLPLPSPDQFIDVLWKQFDFDGLAEFDVDQNLRERIAQQALTPQDNQYDELLVNHGRSVDAIEIAGYFPFYARHFRLSLRDQIQAFTVLNAYARALPESSVMLPNIVVYCVCLRFVNPSRYIRLRDGAIKFHRGIDASNPLISGTSDSGFMKTPQAQALEMYLNSRKVEKEIWLEQVWKIVVENIHQRKSDLRQLAVEYARLYRRVSHIPGFSAGNYVKGVISLLDAFGPDVSNEETRPRTSESNDEDDQAH